MQRPSPTPLRSCPAHQRPAVQRHRSSSNRRQPAVQRLSSGPAHHSRTALAQLQPLRQTHGCNLCGLSRSNGGLSLGNRGLAGGTRSGGLATRRSSGSSGTGTTPMTPTYSTPGRKSPGAKPESFPPLGPAPSSGPRRSSWQCTLLVGQSMWAPRPIGSATVIGSESTSVTSGCQGRTSMAVTGPGAIGGGTSRA